MRQAAGCAQPPRVYACLPLLLQSRSQAWLLQKAAAPLLLYVPGASTPHRQLQLNADCALKEAADPATQAPVHGTAQAVAQRRHRAGTRLPCQPQLPTQSVMSLPMATSCAILSLPSGPSSSSTPACFSGSFRSLLFSTLSTSSAAPRSTSCVGEVRGMVDRWAPLWQDGRRVRTGASHFLGAGKCQARLGAGSQGLVAQQRRQPTPTAQPCACKQAAHLRLLPKLRVNDGQQRLKRVPRLLGLGPVHAGIVRVHHTQPLVPVALVRGQRKFVHILGRSKRVLFCLCGAVRACVRARVCARACAGGRAGGRVRACVCMCVCVRACMRACVRACVHACARMLVCTCIRAATRGLLLRPSTPQPHS